MKPARPRGPARRARPGVRERILDSACELFYREGVRGVGIDRVLAEAGAAKASLYAHYESKDALVAAYLERRSEETHRAILARVEREAEPRARLLSLFDLQREVAKTKGFRGCPFQNASSELAEHEHPAREVTRRHRAWLHDLVRRLVSEAGIRDVERVTRAVMVLYDGAAAAALADGDPRSIDAARWAASRLIAAE